MTQDSSNPPIRARRTHASQALIDALKKLPWALKLSRNKDIEARNALRDVRNAEHAHDPVAHLDLALDNESFLTVSDVPMDMLTPVSRIKKLANKLSNLRARSSPDLREHRRHKVCARRRRTQTRY